MTNRISRYLPEVTTSRPPLDRADRRLKRDVDAMLRDLAFVMKMTERVKSQILEDRESTDALSA
jgi:hypothetical protein